MNSMWNIDNGYQPPFDRLCQKVEEQEKTIIELNERIESLESTSEKNSNNIATAIKTELMLSNSFSRLKKDVENLKNTQGSPIEALDWLMIFVVVSFVVCVMIIPTIGIWFK